jgi:hypothetical protein
VTPSPTTTNLGPPIINSFSNLQNKTGWIK